MTSVPKNLRTRVPADRRTPVLTVAVLQQKGGSGKTTLAINLAAAAHLDGGRALVVDMDRQASAFDWSAASLGSIETWPDTLVTTVNMLLASRHPMFLWWGEDLINIYNDAYVPHLGERHPHALGVDQRCLAHGDRGAALRVDDGIEQALNAGDLDILDDLVGFIANSFMMFLVSYIIR